MTWKHGNYTMTHISSVSSAIMATPELFEHPLADEIMAYEQMQNDLERDFHGRWVILHGSKKIGEDYGSYREAEAAARDLGLDVLACFIRQVGVDSAIFLSYGK